MSEDRAFRIILSNIRSHNSMKNLFETCKRLVQGCLCFELQYTSSENACVLIEKEIYNGTPKK